MKKINNIKKILAVFAMLLTACTALQAQINWDGPQFLDVVYKTASGQDLRLDIHLPKDRANAPVVIYSHGGGWATGDKVPTGSARDVAEGLLEQGVAFVSVEYRLTNNTDIIMQDCITDVKDACRFISKNAALYNVNHREMAHFGDSAGAHIGMVCALTSQGFSAFRGASELSDFSTFSIRGCVAYYGPTSFRPTNETFWTRGGRSLAGFNLRIFGQETSETQQLYLQNLVSPILYMAENSPPLFLVSGDEDTTIPVYHTYGMRSVSNTVDNDGFTYQIVNGAGHNFIQAGDSAISPSRGEIEEQTIAKILSFF